MLHRKWEREHLARKQAEKLLEEKSLELFESNQRLIQMNKVLEQQSELLKRNLDSVESEYQSLVESIDQIIYRTDPEGFVSYANQAASKILGLPIETLLGKHYSELIHPDSREESVKHYESQLENAANESYFELMVTTGDSKQKWLGQTVTLQFDEKGEFQGSVAVARDITDVYLARKALEASNANLEKAREAEHNFFTNMSHEMRTPLNAIIGMASMLESTDLSKDQQELLGDIRTASHSLQNLISNLLDSSKIQSGQIEPTIAKFSPAELLTSVGRTLSQVAASNNLELKVEFDQDLHEAEFISDQGLISQILINLVSNGIKFTESGGVEIRAELDKTKRLLKLRIKDSGIGMTQDVIDRIFDRNYQADTLFQKEGNGLGLTISKQFIDLLQGEISVKSKVGEGSTFEVIFPELSSVSNERDYEDSTAGFNLNAANYHVLVVEDNAMNIKYIEHVLKDAEFKFSIAQTGEEAEQIIEKSTPDIVLLDLQLPDTTGEELARKLREQGFNRPIIAVTASAFVGQRKRALASGMNDYLTKPFRPEDLTKKIFENLRTNLKEVRKTLLDEFYNGDLEFMRLMTKTFLDEIPTLEKELRLAIQNEDRHRIKSLCHKVKPMYAHVGSYQISEKCESFHTLADDQISMLEVKHLYDEMLRFRSELYAAVG